MITLTEISTEVKAYGKTRVKITAPLMQDTHYATAVRSVSQ